MPRKLTDCDRRRLKACAAPLPKVRRFDWLNKMFTAAEQIVSVLERDMQKKLEGQGCNYPTPDKDRPTKKECHGL